jgi:hypothetical protein
MKPITWEDTSRSDFCEVTLHGPKKLQDKRINVLTELAKQHRIKDPEVYLCCMNMATEIADQVYFDSQE